MARLRLSGVILVAFASSLGAADPNIDLSTIIDQPAAESVLGGAVRAPTPININGTDGYYSKCNYYSVAPGKALILRFYQAAAGHDAGAELEHVKASSGLSKTVSGLGDRAEISTGAAGTLNANVTMLYVVKGNALISVGLRGLDEENASAKAKELAQKILEHL
jgi:hypothetical protein